MNKLVDIIEKLNAEEQIQVLEFAQSLLKLKSYEEKVNALHYMKNDMHFQQDLQDISEDFSNIDFG